MDDKEKFDLGKWLESEAQGRILNWRATDEDAKLIAGIVDRVFLLCKIYAPQAMIDRLQVHMDLTCAHLNDSPLNLRAMLEAEPESLLHDVSAIKIHIDRKTGQLPAWLRLRCVKNPGKI